MSMFVSLSFFFFKQKTAYEMRISDWSSDVCSSDLPDGEAWLRNFGGQRMRSHLRRDGRMLVERLGPVRFRFALHAQDGELWWRVNGVKLFGVLPLPASQFDGVYCREGEAEGRYTFEVEAALPDRKSTRLNSSH